MSENNLFGLEKTLVFIDKTAENIERIGPNHQVLGLTHKGKYELGNTRMDKSNGRVYCSLYYAVKIAVLD